PSPTGAWRKGTADASSGTPRSPSTSPPCLVRRSAGGSTSPVPSRAVEVTMQRVTRDRIQYVFDRHPEPVLRVAPGEVFEVETEDARTGRTRTPETITPEYVLSLRSKGTYYGNPVTGPIRIEGAEPGDVLAVRLHALECDTLGFFGYWPFVYHLQDW